MVNFSISSESRYLLLLTENYAALNAILSVLHELDSEIEPYVLFGSGFPKDKEFTQVFLDFIVMRNLVSVYFVVVHRCAVTSAGSSTACKQDVL